MVEGHDVGIRNDHVEVLQRVIAQRTRHGQDALDTQRVKPLEMRVGDAKKSSHICTAECPLWFQLISQTPEIIPDIIPTMFLNIQM
uniref:Uncharacterized protein n=1 Tax=Anabas testudineus TaxID=64144 RepID=A0A3Q1IPL0_ANATE